MTGSVNWLVSKVAALAILGGLLAGLFAFVVAPLAETYSALDERVTSERELLGRLTAAQKVSGASSASAVLPPAQQVFLDGESDALRIAGLQSKLSERAGQLQLRLTSTQAVTPREAAGARLVGVQTQLSGPIERVQQFVYAIETAQPPLIVDQLSISKGPSSGDLEPIDLDVRIVVLGATLPDRSKP